ncbi:MAG: 3-hydroxyacyl-ACP dehydratase FabZ [Immundisolibacteraceae bacterium]|nr:3-hydroxyacyl-ACP dehydratase FabZ [Immundisolibacteraceae bacterium]
MDINQIMSYLPHRYPFLLIDRVTECVVGERLVALKNVTANEPFFNGHFPGYPVMPGVLILEAMAQAAGILGFRTNDSKPDENNVYLFVGIDKARFRRQVGPGDQLRIEVTLERVARGMWQFNADATVDGERAATCEIMCTLKAVG